MEATETGEYDRYCAELCGSGHSRMDGIGVDLNQSEFDQWLVNRSNASDN